LSFSHYDFADTLTFSITKEPRNTAKGKRYRRTQKNSWVRNWSFKAKTVLKVTERFHIVKY